MIRWLSYLSAFVVAMSGSTLPSLGPLKELVVPAHLDGAVFVDGDRIAALSSEASNLTNGPRRCFLSVWDIQQERWLVSKAIEGVSSQASCGTIGYSSSLRRLLITADSELLLLNPQTFELARKISVKPDHIVGLGEDAAILYSLSEPTHKPVTLTSYNLVTGDVAQRKELPQLDYGLETTVRVAGLPHEQLAVLQSDAKPLGVPQKNSTLAIYPLRGDTVGNDLQIPMPVANFLVSGDTLLFVSDGFADQSPKSRNQCVASLALSTLRLNPQAYCRSDAGVHYALANLGSDFVIGYSGYGARRGWLDDGLMVTKSSSISIWDAQSGRLTAIAPVPHGRSFTLSSSVIRADTSGMKRFLFYNASEGSRIMLYDLQHRKGD